MKALLVDDERMARQELRRLLLAHPEIEIAAEAQNGDQALDLIPKLAPDVVFLDIQMPGMTGFELLSRLPTEPMVVSLVVHVPVTGMPSAVAVSMMSFGAPLTMMFGPPAGVITPPAMVGGPPSPVMMPVVPPLPVMMPLVPPEPSPPPPGRVLTEPLDFVLHAGKTAASARVRASHRIANPSRPEKRAIPFITNRPRIGRSARRNPRVTESHSQSVLANAGGKRIRLRSTPKIRSPRVSRTYHAVFHRQQKTWSNKKVYCAVCGFGSHSHERAPRAHARLVRRLRYSVNAGN